MSVIYRKGALFDDNQDSRQNRKAKNKNKNKKRKLMRVGFEPTPFRTTDDKIKGFENLNVAP